MRLLTNAPALLLASSAILCAPAWGMYKCVVDGKTSFQETPCAGAQAQTKLKEQYAPPVATAAPSPSALSDQEKLATAERERLRRDAEYALRDANAAVSNHRAACDREQQYILGDKVRSNNNLAGAVRDQSISAEAQAAATRCDTRARELLAQVESARKRCDQLGCR
ncbi:DUF4124 domain-containing protein [Variovorax sp. V116]|uniref:DUF4124 domain-containing protein n=1 Tax=Variovorax sp. V116 TaxID=3065953 RepID=UPI0034E88A0D